MANKDRNRTNETKEPDRNVPADRSGQPAGHPGGYGPAQEPVSGDANKQDKDSAREPSQEH
jgi:hypothetical protein